MHGKKLFRSDRMGCVRRNRWQNRSNLKGLVQMRLYGCIDLRCCKIEDPRTSSEAVASYAFNVMAGVIDSRDRRQRRSSIDGQRPAALARGVRPWDKSEQVRYGAGMQVKLTWRCASAGAAYVIKELVLACSACEI
jgi:hypothetical protein